MAFNPLIPQASDRIKDSQSAILENFTTLNNVLNVNGPYLDFSAAAAVPTLGAGHVGIITQTSTYTGNSELCTLKGAIAQEFTGYGAVGGPNYEGWTRLPSGILLKWAQGEFTGGTLFTWPVAASIPAFTTVFHCQVTTRALTDGANTDAYVLLKTFNTTTATLYISQRTAVAPATARFQILCIGV